MQIESDYLINGFTGKRQLLEYWKKFNFIVIAVFSFFTVPCIANLQNFELKTIQFD